FLPTCSAYIGVHRIGLLALQCTSSASSIYRHGNRAVSPRTKRERALFGSTNTMPLTIRQASPEDLEAVQRVLVKTWHATYFATLGRDKVDEITASWHWLARLARDLDEKACFLVAERDGRLVGTASAHKGADGNVTLSRLYVLPEAQGERIGTRLL